jgi:hypothetical protein
MVAPIDLTMALIEPTRALSEPTKAPIKPTTTPNKPTAAPSKMSCHSNSTSSKKGVLLDIPHFDSTSDPIKSKYNSNGVG